MESFEYCTVFIVWDDKTRYYVEKDKNGSPNGARINNLSGIDPILNSYGSQGWELVSMVAENFNAYYSSNSWVLAYRVVFKRSK